MRTPRKLHVVRLAFTLVELLVVIAIIGILISLLSAAIFPYLLKGPEAQVRNEMSQMSNALGNFKQRFGIYPPSTVYLANNITLYDMTKPLHKESYAILTQIWPRLDLKAGVDWSGGKTMVPQILEGDQCLVFFLGGMQTTTAMGTNGCLGFSAVTTNPTLAGGQRIDPFFNFDSSRLTPVGFYFTYTDKFDKNKYAYFSAGKRRNGYNLLQLATGQPDPMSSDCARLRVMPYAEVVDFKAGHRFHHPDSFQIVSAGEDGVFGPGGMWTAPNAPAIAAAGRDDMTNFHTRRMNIP